MKKSALLVLSVGLVLSTAACSQYPASPNPQNENAPATMGAGGYGYGYGPGMMGGGGYGPGMMGGGGYGPGMMGGPDGYGPGMMGGGYGQGPGMMWGGPGGAWPGIADLTDEQRNRIAQIQKEYRQKQWSSMQAMHELQFQQGGSRDGMFDEQAARQAFAAREALRKQMFENSIQMQKAVDAVLTPKQREQLRAGRPR